MAYTKNSWQTGDTVTAAKLNHAEDGIETANQNALPAVTSDDNGDVLTVVEGAWAKAGPNVLIINVSESGENIVFDKTAKQVFDAFNARNIIFVSFGSGYISLLASIAHLEDSTPAYTFSVLSQDTISDARVFVPIDFTADSDNDYPSALAD